MEKEQQNEFTQFTEEDIEKIFGGSAVQAAGTLSGSTDSQSQSTERMQLQERYTASSDNLT